MPQTSPDIPAPPPAPTPGSALDPTSPRLLEAVVQSMSTGLVIQDLGGRIIDCNPAAESILGLSRDQIMGRTSIDARWAATREDGSPFPGEAHPSMITLATGAPCRDVLMGVSRPDGTRSWIQINSEPVHDAQGRLQGAVATFSDITELKRRDALLRDKESLWRLAIDSGDHGVWDWNPITGGLQFSASFYDRLGATGMSLQEWESLLHPDDLAGARAAVAKGLARDGEGYLTEFRVITRSGETRHIVARGKVVERDELGRAVRMVGTHTDDTERHEMRLRLAESEDRFRFYADATPLPMWMSAPPGNRILFNHAWLAATGQPVATQLGQGWMDGLHPEDRPRVASQCSGAIAGQRAVTLEYRLRQADGSFRHYLDHAVPRLDAAGKLLGFLGLCVDIEDRYQAEATIRQLSRAIEQITLSVVITDPDGRIEFVNTACVDRYGYPREALIGQRASLFSAGTTPLPVFQGMWAAIRDGQTWTGEMLNRSAAGVEILESIAISPVRDEAGQITHYVALMEDVTEQRASEARARELELRFARLDRLHSLNTLVSGIAHDFNNILVSILGFSELGQVLLQRGREPERALRYLEEIQTAGERARTLVGKLLAYGRSDHSAVLDVSLAHLIGEAGNLVAASLPIGMSIELDCEPESLMLEGDGGQLLQLLTNLMLNARDAMVDCGVIRVRVRLERVDPSRVCESCNAPFAGEFIRIDVADTGAGIDAESRPHLFEPFFTTKDVGRGTGMGLAVVHGVTHRHGGHLTLDSAPRKGSCFSVYLARGSA